MSTKEALKLIDFQELYLRDSLAERKAQECMHMVYSARFFNYLFGLPLQLMFAVRHSVSTIG